MSTMYESLGGFVSEGGKSTLYERLSPVSVRAEKVRLLRAEIKDLTEKLEALLATQYE